MIGSETFIIVAFMCSEKSTPCAFASSICSARKVCSLATLMRASRLTNTVRLILASQPTSGAPHPGLYDVLNNTLEIMQVRITRSRMAGDPPDLLVTPRLPDFALLDLYRAGEAIDEGHRATKLALSALALAEREVAKSEGDAEPD